MAKEENLPSSSEDVPTSPPRDLHPTSDIRFVMIEMGKLVTKVDRLIEDVKDHGKEIKSLGHKMSFAQGAFWVAGIGAGIIVAAVGLVLTGKVSVSFIPGH